MKDAEKMKALVFIFVFCFIGLGKGYHVNQDPVVDRSWFQQLLRGLSKYQMYFCPPSHIALTSNEWYMWVCHLPYNNNFLFPHFSFHTKLNIILVHRWKSSARCRSSNFVRIWRLTRNVFMHKNINRRILNFCIVRSDMQFHILLA